MKLVSITLKNTFNSLQSFESVNISHANRDDGKVDPLCLIGVNGSGKSNLLELITETFYYVELNNRFERDKKNKTKSSREIELVYSLKKYPTLKIKIETVSSPISKLHIQKDSEDTWAEIIGHDEILNYLPEKVVGYTSGLNETLSFRFNQLDDLYSEKVLENAKSKSKTLLQDNRLIFLDNESNEAIVVSNFLFEENDELELFDDLLRIKELDTFKIIINLRRKGKTEYVVLSYELLDYIEKFKKCSICYNEDPLKYYEFDFLNTKAARDAFKDHFGSVYKLFMAFQKFKLLNPINLEKSHRKVKSEDDLLDNKPTLAKSDKVFRFEELNLIISKPLKSIPYIGISDGEHQFMQIVGATKIFEQDDVLFLLDEPETHFNPYWRTKFIHVLNENIKGRNQDIVITTHSPYIVSDCKGYRVYKFIRTEDKVTFEEIGIETFGTSFDLILKKAFDIEGNISEEASLKIQTLLNSNNVKEIQDFIDESGPSFEKMALLKHLKKLETEE